MIQKERKYIMIINETERNNLIYEMEKLLDAYDYEYSTDALNTIIDEWARQKEELITLFKKHPNYVEGKFLIAFDTDFEREINMDGIDKFFRWLLSEPVYNTENLPPEINQQRIEENCGCLPNQLFDLLYYTLQKFYQSTVTETIAEQVNFVLPSIRASVGQKTSRLANKIFTYLGYNKHPDYNKEFAKYADYLNPLTIKRHTVLSLNPLDYLTMSFGNSWASCHTIDKQNKRNMPNSYEGQYSSGTMSYMLDPSSMVFYTVDKSYNGTDYWTQPKINRQMFHYGEDKLVQGRLYPQKNDGCSDVYTPYRNIVQSIMATILEIPNLWTFKKGTSVASGYINSEGTHYRDYECYGDCTLSTIKGSQNENKFDVGAPPICIECGNEHDIEECISCCSSYVTRCEHCGAIIRSSDDEYWVGDYCYCRDCVNYCECCHEYHREDEFYIRGEDRYVCQSCVDEYYYYCDNCEEYVHRDDTVYIDGEDIDVCSDCADRFYRTCEVCGELYHRDHMEECDGEYYCQDCYKELNTDEDEAC
jgi:hypothetical protein